MAASSPPSVPQQKKSRRFIGISIFAILLIGCAGLGTVTANWASAHISAYVQHMEQAVKAAKTVPQKPQESIESIEQTRFHLSAASSELNELRPVVEPVVAVADKITGIPMIGPVLEQSVALWTFANSTTNLGEALLDTAEISIPYLQNKDIAGFAEKIPLLQQHLQTARIHLTAAQAARKKLGTISWLPESMASRFASSLDQWDQTAPKLEVGLTEANHFIEEVDIPQTLDAAQTLTQELKQTSRIASKILAQTNKKNQIVTIQQAQAHLIAARIAFETLTPAAELFITRGDRLSNLLGEDLIDTEQLEAWWQFTGAVIVIGQELSDAAELGLTKLDQADIAGLTAAMPTLHNHLQATGTALAQAKIAREKIGAISGLPANITRPLKASLTQWDELSPQLEDALPKAERIAKVLPLMLGSEEPVTYLLLLQSSDELRATGGFIGGLGTIRIENGEIIEVIVGESRGFGSQPVVENGQLLRRIQPPEPLEDYMGLGHWYLRDANWWADFPATARQAAKLWYAEHDTPIDGVVAVTDQGVKSLLKAIGPVRSPRGELITEQNVKEVASIRIYQSKEDRQRNQTIFLQEMAIVFTALTNNFQSKQAFQLAKYLPNAVARRDLLMTSFDPPLAAILHDLGVDGAIAGQSDDFFYLVESNVSYNKLSPFVQQDLRYQVDLGPDGWPTLATLTVDERNTYTPGDGLVQYPKGYYQGRIWNEKTRKLINLDQYYGGYTRLFPPPQSEFVAVTGFDDNPEISIENHRPVVGGYIGLVSDEPKQLQFKWKPGGQPSVPGQYQLLVQRQPGAPEHVLTVTVNLPDGYQAVNVAPPSTFITDSEVTWHAVCDQDQIFSLVLQEIGEQSADISTDNTGAGESVEPTENTDNAQAAVTESRDDDTPSASPTAQPNRAPLPQWLSIPIIGVGAPITPVGLEPSGIMASPVKADIAGWYELGPRPGEPSNAIIAAHIDWNGEIGAFVRLHELKPGDTIEVKSGPDTRFHYVVESIETYPADAAPVAAIFGRTSAAQLTLITCGGPYDHLRQEYRDRIVVRARGQ